MDKFSKEERSKIMAAIHGKSTKPEVVVRKWLWNHGMRYRLNNPRLPGHPDIVMKKFRTCIFVNGCFWHGHRGCKAFTIPKTNTEFWQKKIERNQERDREVQWKLASMGWHSIVIWECQLKPAVHEDTLTSLLYTLNHIYLKDHSIKYDFSDKTKFVRMAAEPDSDDK